MKRKIARVSTEFFIYEDWIDDKELFNEASTESKLIYLKNLAEEIVEQDGLTIELLEDFVFGEMKDTSDPEFNKFLDVEMNKEAIRLNKTTEEIANDTEHFDSIYSFAYNKFYNT